MTRVTDASLTAQEDCFARAFSRHDPSLARPLYHPAVVYLSPTVRLFDWPTRIEGIDRTLEFIALTIQQVREITYRAVEWAIVPTGDAAFVRLQFDFTRDDRRLRSDYVVIYRYRDGLIVQQEVYYDPSARLPELAG